MTYPAVLMGQVVSFIFQKDIFKKCLEQLVVKMLTGLNSLIAFKIFQQMHNIKKTMVYKYVTIILHVSACLGHLQGGG